jgi:Tfp pilus assembly protein PilF
MAYQMQKNYPQAKKEFQSALEINPNFTQAGEVRKMLAQTPPQQQHN